MADKIYSLQDDPRLVALAQFLFVFGPAYGIGVEEQLTPSEIEYAIENPDLDPFIGELVSKFLSRKAIRPDEGEKIPVKYEVWNE